MRKQAEIPWEWQRRLPGSGQLVDNPQALANVTYSIWFYHYSIPARTQGALTVAVFS